MYSFLIYTFYDRTNSFICLLLCSVVHTSCKFDCVLVHQCKQRATPSSRKAKFDFSLTPYDRYILLHMAICISRIMMRAMQPSSSSFSGSSTATSSSGPSKRVVGIVT